MSFGEPTGPGGTTSGTSAHEHRGTPRDVEDQVGTQNPSQVIVGLGKRTVGGQHMQMHEQPEVMSKTLHDPDDHGMQRSSRRELAPYRPASRAAASG